MWVFGKCEALSVKDHREAVVCDLQNKAAVDQTVGGLEATVAQTSQVKILHSLKKQREKKEKRRLKYVNQYKTGTEAGV